MGSVSADDTGFSGNGPLDDQSSLVSESEQLAESAMALLGCESEEDVYDVICDFMVRLVPGAMIVVNEITPDLSSFEMRRLAGVEDSLPAKAADLVGFDAIGTRSQISPTLRAQLLSGSLTSVPGGFVGVALNGIPSSVSAAVSRLFGMHELFAVGITDGDDAVGNIAISTSTSQVTLPTHIIESFARHCYSAIAAIRRQRDLLESITSSRLVLGAMVEGLALHEIIADENGEPIDYRYLDVNPAFEEIRGLDAKDLIGRTALEIDPETDAASIARYAAVAATGESVRFTEHDGEAGREFEVTAYCPKPGQFVSVISDITDRARAEAELLEANARLVEMLYATATAIGQIVEVRDPYTQGHELRVASLGVQLAQEMGLPADEIAGVDMAGMLHDIGKVGVPAEILTKPGRLSASEFAIIQEHPQNGYDILKAIPFPWPVAESALQHHERVDGSGYPQGLVGDEICRTARILAVADVIEAMASHRPYRAALGVDAAIEEVHGKPELFDQEVVAALMRLSEAGQLEL
jgi:PAS domain S-box-containing protein